MAGRIVFLLEEPSMKVLLEAWLPRLFPGWASGQHFLCIAHEGKSDLDRSIARKLAAWQFPGDRFVIVRDTDGADCLTVKARLVQLCRQTQRPDTLVRLVCQELESWYLGDLAALEAAMQARKIDTPANRKKFAHPDSWQKPSEQVKRLAPAFQKISGARAMAAHLEPDRNLSHSLRVFVGGLRRLAS
ncbi:MAG: DUF4276 family protein [Brachymonas sp.]|nr:DUF4276 family protein [Brachymonas sp.]